MKDNEFLLHVLADGRDHALTEILQRSIATRGHGLTVHSRAAELRKRGYTIKVARVPGAERGRAYTYRWVVDEKHPVVGVLRAASLDESVSPPLLPVGGGIDGTFGGAARSALREPSASHASGSTDGSRSAPGMEPLADHPGTADEMPPSVSDALQLSLEVAA